LAAGLHDRLGSLQHSPRPPSWVKRQGPLKRKGGKRIGREKKGKEIGERERKGKKCGDLRLAYHF